MKKSILAVAVVLGATTTFAQDLTSKHGEAYLPEAGDYAIGIDAVPVLNYIGNFFGKTADNNYANGMWGFNNPNMVITGKYFVEDQMAYRAGIRLGFGNNKGSAMVVDRADTTAYDFPNEPGEVENTEKHSFTNVGITAGLEWRKGKGRLQGFYGAEIGFMIANTKSEYTYGNELNQSDDADNVDVDATADAMNGGANIDPAGMNTSIVGNARVLESKSGTTFGVGLRGFIGAEYFIIPKLSLGGEFGWGLTFIGGGTASTTYEGEGINGSGDEAMETFTDESSNGSSFGIDTDANNAMFGPAGRVNLIFHF